MNSKTPDQMPFAVWMATLLNLSEPEVEDILENSDALHFLIAWSFFESKCFSGSMNLNKINRYSEDLSRFDLCQNDFFVKVANHFHERYQNLKRLRDLANHQQECISLLNPLINKSFSNLSDQEKVFLTVTVIYRFRNNIFHGNKKVNEWLKYKKQIVYCTKTMQVFVLHAIKNNNKITKL